MSELASAGLPVAQEFARLGSASVYEAAGRRGLVDLELHQIVAGGRAAGPARPVRCGQHDNLMVHAAIAHARPGDVLVLTMPEARPVALVGELLAIQALTQGVAALLVDGAVRDVEELASLGLPVWARWVRIAGAGKAIAASSVSSCGPEPSPTISTVCASVSSRSDSMPLPPHDIAHIAHVELLTPAPDQSLSFFTDVLGMEVQARDGQSVFLRGWGEYQTYSLKLTESEGSGLGHMALRTWSPEALERRDRGKRAGPRLGRRRRGPRSGLSLDRPRRPSHRALLRMRALRGAGAFAPGSAQPTPALYGARGGRSAPRPRQPPGPGREGMPALCHRRARLPPL